jgi:hypothetical protein
MSGLGGGKEAKVYSLAVVNYTRLPLSALMVPRHALKSAGVGVWRPTVPRILGARSKPKVAAPIVEAIAVNMVDHGIRLSK